MSSASVNHGGRCPEFPESVVSIVDVIEERSRSLPNVAVCHAITRTRTGFDERTVLPGELLAESASLAAALTRTGVGAGDRVLLSITDAVDFLRSFCAAQLLGAIAVPLPSAAEVGAPRAFASRIQSVCRDCDPVAVIADDPSRFLAAIGGSGASLPIVSPHERGDFRGARHDANPSEIAFIQYTSGSTSDPKGVVVTHSNVKANCHAIRDATSYTTADRMVSWLPLHHDMGLIGGLLTSIYCAAETWILPPLAFLGRPATWLEAIGRFRATLTVAPTFAYSLCARRLSDKQLTGIDLSTLRLAYVGAEVVDEGTVNAFCDRFAPHGFARTAIYPVYGLAEATLAATFPVPGTGALVEEVDRDALTRDGHAVRCQDHANALRVVSVGRSMPGHAIRIVDPETGIERDERLCGELVVSGPSVTPRYFHEPISHRRSELRTGDLGFRVGDQYFVIDRLKDLVILAGQSLSPADIEAVVAETRGVRRGRAVAFSLAAFSEGTERLHIVAELDIRCTEDPKTIIESIERTVRTDLGLRATVTLVAPGSLERTSSGKLMRRACARAFAEGRLRSLGTRQEVRSLRWRQQASVLTNTIVSALRSALGKAP